MTTSLCLRTGLVIIALSFGSGLGCNPDTDVSDLSIEEGAGGASEDAARWWGKTSGGSSGAATTAGAGGCSGSGASGSSGSTSSSSASSSSASSSSASSSAASSSSATTGGGATDPAQLCVDKINDFRATLNLPPYARWTAEEVCTSDEAAQDAAANQPHSAFGQCGEWAQNECPGWSGPPGSMIGKCLQMMWNEGPGPSNQGHGHYNAMSSKSYKKVACGFHVLPSGKVWATQNFR